MEANSGLRLARILGAGIAVITVFLLVAEFASNWVADVGRTGVSIICDALVIKTAYRWVAGVDRADLSIVTLDRRVLTAGEGKAALIGTVVVVVAVCGGDGTVRAHRVADGVGAEVAILGAFGCAFARAAGRITGLYGAGVIVIARFRVRGTITGRGVAVLVRAGISIFFTVDREGNASTGNVVA